MTKLSKASLLYFRIQYQIFFSFAFVIRVLFCSSVNNGVSVVKASLKDHEIVLTTSFSTGLIASL